MATCSDASLPGRPRPLPAHVRQSWLARAVLLGAWASCIAGAGQADAKSLAGVTMPDLLTVQGCVLRLNGLGLRSFTILQVHGYVAGLYIPAPAHDAQTILDAPGIKLLRIQYVHGAGIGRVLQEFRDGRKLNCASGCPKEDDPAFAQLLGTARAVKPGDVTTYIYDRRGVDVLFNGEKLASIANPDFARRMLAGMIGSHPPSKPLRDGLLGS